MNPWKTLAKEMAKTGDQVRAERSIIPVGETSFPKFNTPPTVAPAINENALPLWVVPALISGGLLGIYYIYTKLGNSNVS